MEQKQLDLNGKKVSYRSNGRGPLVVLLHGFGEDGTAWKNQYDLFSANTLLIPDLPGSGGSEMIDEMSMEGMADWLKELMNRAAPPPPKGELANVQPTLVEEFANKVGSLQRGPSSDGHSPLGGWGGCVLIGHSMGGYIALAFAERHPEALTGFGLFHSTAFADSEEKRQARRKGIAFMKEHGAHAFLKTTIPTLFSSKSKDDQPDLIDELLEMVRNADTDAHVNYYEAMMARPDRTAVLKNTTVPVAFVMGRHDTAIPLEDMLKQCHLPARSHIHLLEDSGHMGMMEEVQETNRILLDFVENTATI